MRYLTDRWCERLISHCLALVLLLCLGTTASGVEKIYYHINDPSGSPAMIVEPDGAVVARYAYTPFGSQVSAQPASRQRLGFVGGIQETASLHYLKHRYYNPQLGRFYQPDPVSFLERGATQINRNGYGLNDPYTHQDKDGRCLPVCLLAGAAALAPEEMATLTIGCARFCGPFLNFVEGLFNPGASSPAEFIESRLAASIKIANSEIGFVASGVRYGPLNIGPLDDAVAATFRGGSYTAMTLSENTTLYRVYGGSAGKLGSYWTRTPPTGPLQSQLDLALAPQWGNTAQSIISIEAPKGTVVYEGVAAPQLTGVGSILGGGNQVYIPRIDPAWIK